MESASEVCQSLEDLRERPVAAMRQALGHATPSRGRVPGQETPSSSSPRFYGGWRSGRRTQVTEPCDKKRLGSPQLHNCQLQQLWATCQAT